MIFKFSREFSLVTLNLFHKRVHACCFQSSFIGQSSRLSFRATENKTWVSFPLMHRRMTSSKLQFLPFSDLRLGGRKCIEVLVVAMILKLVKDYLFCLCCCLLLLGYNPVSMKATLKIKEISPWHYKTKLLGRQPNPPLPLQCMAGISWSCTKGDYASAEFSTSLQVLLYPASLAVDSDNCKSARKLSLLLLERNKKEKKKKAMGIIVWLPYRCSTGKTKTSSTFSL